MGEPRDSVALATARRVLDQSVVADALAARGSHQEAHGFELVIPWEDHRLDLRPASPVVPLLLHLQMHEARQKVEQAVALQHLLPQVRGAVAAPARIRRVAGAAIAAAIEGKKVGGVAGEARSHQNRLGVHRKMHNCTPLEAENRYSWITIRPVLLAGILDVLSRHWILQLQGDDRDPVDAQRHIERLLRTRRIMKLARQPDAVGRVARVQLRIQPVRRLEERDVQSPAVALEPMPERRQGAVGVHPTAQIA